MKKLLKKIGGSFADASKWIWGKTNGGKTIVGVVLHAGWFYANAKHFKLSLETNVWVHTSIGTLTGVGLGHKAKKGEITKAIKFIGRLLPKK